MANMSFSMANMSFEFIWWNHVSMLRLYADSKAEPILYIAVVLKPKPGMLQVANASQHCACGTLVVFPESLLNKTCVFFKWHQVTMSTLRFCMALGQLAGSQMAQAIEVLGSPNMSISLVVPGIVQRWESRRLIGWMPCQDMSGDWKDVVPKSPKPWEASEVVFTILHCCFVWCLIMF